MKAHESYYALQQVKNAVVVHQVYHGNGPFGHTQQQTKKLTMQI
jgi:hypothetical protein